MINAVNSSNMGFVLRNFRKTQLLIHAKGHPDKVGRSISGGDPWENRYLELVLQLK